MIKRTIGPQISGKLNKGKAILLFGPRQTGKTTLLHQLLDTKHDVMWLNGDEPDVQQLFGNASSSRLKSVFGENKTIVRKATMRYEGK